MPTRPDGDRAPPRPANRREAGGAPAIGIEARKGRDPAPPGLGAKHESPGPKGIALRPRETVARQRQATPYPSEAPCGNIAAAGEERTHGR